MSNIAGGWSFDAIESCKLPQKIATGFTKTVEPLVGAQYIPALYCGSQIAAGINHLLICKQVVMTCDRHENLVKVILHEAPNGDEFSIIAIENIF